MGITLSGKMLALFQKCDKNGNGVIEQGDWTKIGEGDPHALQAEDSERNWLLSSIFNFSDYGFSNINKEEFTSKLEEHKTNYGEDGESTESYIDGLLETAKKNAEMCKGQKPRMEIDAEEDKKDAEANAYWEDFQAQQDAAEANSQT